MCNGICSICRAPCFRGVINNEFVESIKASTSEVKKELAENVENAGTYELVRLPFKKEKVRKIK